MRAVIVGWYGTETMGDKAILDGILSVLSEIDPTMEVAIGSLFPFYTNRTLLEEKKVFGENAHDISLCVFDVKNIHETENIILESDILIFGGGPIMSIDEIFLIRNLFALAYNNGVCTVLMGCGLGPLTNEKTIHAVSDIIKDSRLIIFRDNLSLSLAKELGLNGDFFVLEDPAIISLENYLYHEEKKEIAMNKKYIVMNFREYPQAAYGGNYKINDEEYRELIRFMEVNNNEVLLIPMHNFFVGGDDRYYLAKIAESTCSHVEHEIFDLRWLYRIIQNASGCVGMRYHSVVFQTLLNGNNYIVDYTGKANGKIAGFVKDIDGESFYRERTVYVADGEHLNAKKIYSELFSGKKFEYKTRNVKNKYVSALMGVL